MPEETEAFYLYMLFKIHKGPSATPTVFEQRTYSMTIIEKKEDSGSFKRT